MRQLLAINGKGEHPGGIIALLMDHRVRDTGFKGGVVGGEIPSWILVAVIRRQIRYLPLGFAGLREIGEIHLVPGAIGILDHERVGVELLRVQSLDIIESID